MLRRGRRRFSRSFDEFIADASLKCVILSIVGVVRSAEAVVVRESTER